MSVVEIQTRMAAIAARFAVPTTAAAAGGVLGGAPASSSASSSAASSAASFATELAKVGSPPAAAAEGANAEKVIAFATKQLGVPYVWGGTDPATGLDCSGLTQLVYGQAGMQLPRVSWEQARAGTAVASLADAKPGDLLAFNRPVDHIAIYLGDNKMIHAPKPGKVVEISDVYATPSAIRRVLPDAPVSASPYAALFAQAASRTGVPAKVLAAVASAESGFDPTAVSPAGARGLMQLMPGTARELGVDPMDPASAIDGASRLLARHLKEFGSFPLALAAYNAGPGAVTRAGGIPPYAETRAYVQKIMSALGGTAA